MDNMGISDMGVRGVRVETFRAVHEHLFLLQRYPHIYITAVPLQEIGKYKSSVMI
jgi:hypothetical protein